MIKSELQNRTKKFALDVINFVSALPNNPTVEIISKQLMKSATLAGAKYRLAIKFKSKINFIKKIQEVEQEIDESAYWLELLNELPFKYPDQIHSLLEEADNLTVLFGNVEKNAKKNN